jgi:hypothetical protein
MNERLAKLLTEVRAAQSADWVAVRDRLFELHRELPTFEDKGDCLAAFKQLMDAVEQQASITDRVRLREARRKDYHLFVVNESMIDGQVEPAKLDQVTLREVRAGRMAVNHRLRILAIFSAYGFADLLTANPEFYAALTAGSD